MTQKRLLLRLMQRSMDRMFISDIEPSTVTLWQPHCVGVQIYFLNKSKSKWIVL